MIRRRFAVGSIAVYLATLACGCCHTCCKKRCGDRLPPGEGAVIGTPSTIPPANIAPRASYYYPPQAEVLLPENRGFSPATPIRTPPPPANSDFQARKPSAFDAMPVGIAEYRIVRDGLWTGLRPELDGLDWLKAKGTRLAIFLRTPGDTDAADRPQFEKRGIAFESFEVAPDTLNEDLYRRFAQLVKSPGPVFVYDRDGSVKGYLWYAFLRVNDLESEDSARIRAAGYGYAVDGLPPRRELALAAQRIIEKVK